MRPRLDQRHLKALIRRRDGRYRTASRPAIHHIIIGIVFGLQRKPAQYKKTQNQDALQFLHGSPILSVKMVDAPTRQKHLPHYDKKTETGEWGSKKIFDNEYPADGLGITSTCVDRRDNGPLVGRAHNSDVRYRHRPQYGAMAFHLS
jgi:hypothetical protein